VNSGGQVVGIFHGLIEDPEKGTKLMAAPIEHVGEGPTPAAIADFFFKHPVSTMPVSPGSPMRPSKTSVEPWCASSVGVKSVLAEGAANARPG
jgi:hypothetical protein